MRNRKSESENEKSEIGNRNRNDSEILKKNCMKKIKNNQKNKKIMTLL